MDGQDPRRAPSQRPLFSAPSYTNNPNEANHMVTRDAFYSDTAPSGDPQYIGAPQPYGYSPTDARQLDLQQASYAVVAAEYDASVQPQLLSTFGDQFDQRPGSSIPHLPDQTAYNLADVSPPGQPSLPVYSDDHEMSMVQQDSAAYWSSRSQFNGEFDTFRSTLRSDDLKLAGQQIMAISEWFLPRALQMGLASDDADINRDGHDLWQLFNNGWLAFLQKQYDASLVRPLPDNLLSFSELRFMSRRLILLVDALEGTGLQAVENGVWEESILAKFNECLDALQSQRGEMAEPDE